MQPTILVVDDEPRLAQLLALALEPLGANIVIATGFVAAQQRLEAEKIDCVITDLRMPDGDGRQLIGEATRINPDIPVIVMTAFASVRDAVELVRAGAFDYFEKPFEVDDVIATVRRALRLHTVVTENKRLREALDATWNFDRLEGESPVFRALLQQIADVSPSRATVLLQGESGTGKELVARAIHFNSPRKEASFVAVNCAAIPEGLLESELFGHTKGAFTGATTSREGRFLAADRGTLFLDEIADLPLGLQSKVLRVLQEQSFEPVGSNRTVTVDVRVVAATHYNLKRLVDEGRFRHDLYYRLAVFPIELPALRDRAEDICLLAGRFLSRYAGEMGKTIKGFSPVALEAMAAYGWPGNIRELQNCVERAVIVCRTDQIEASDLPREVEHAVGRRPEIGALEVPSDLDAELERIERGFIQEALRQASGVQVRAAERLGITERSLWHRIKKLGVRIGRTVETD